MQEKKQFEKINDALLIRAPAKINLSLLVAGKRADGFHNLKTIMAKINWFDEVLIEKNIKKGITLVNKGPYWAPAGKKNLVCRACKLILEHAQTSADLRITLTKNIPAGTGLGSASSDAAATLLGVNKFLGLGLGRGVLKKIAAMLGSDVAFFLNGPLAFCTSKGEKVKKIEKKFNFLAILVVPDVTSSTKTVYGNYRHDDRLFKVLSLQINKLMVKNKIDLIVGLCANMLQDSCFGLYKGIEKIKNKVESLGIKPLCLSGSGSTLYYIIENRDRKKALMFQQKLTDNVGCKSIIVSSNRW